jgi:hypothetical protein
MRHAASGGYEDVALVNCVVVRIDARWRDNADDPGVFAREFFEATELLETGRGPGLPFRRLSTPR